MARREKGSAHLFKDMATSLHIKKNTAGRSNEISLSVLDGLKSQADNRLGEADQKVRLGDLSIFTVSPKKEKKASFIDKPSSGAVGSSQQGVSRVAPESKRGTNRKAKEGASADGKSGATRPDSFASKLAKKEASAKRECASALWPTPMPRSREGRELVGYAVRLSRRSCLRHRLPHWSSADCT